MSEPAQAEQPQPRILLYISVAIQDNALSIIWRLRHPDWPEGRWVPYSFTLTPFN